MNTHNHHSTSPQHKDLYCLKCGNSERQYVELQCGHVFCILCAAYTYIKSRISVQSDASIKCIKCNCVSELDEEFVGLINETLKEEVIPSLDPTESFVTQNKLLNRNLEKSHYVETVDRKIKSEEHSFQNITPSTAKYFFSKCESPSSRKKRENQHLCRHHSMENLAYVCITCQAELLCIKCISGAKKHAGHQIKDIRRGIQIIKEQLGQTKLDLGYRIDEMEMWQRRIEDRKKNIKQKCMKAMNEIQARFEELRSSLKLKEEELVQNCREHFDQLLQRLYSEDQKVNFCIDLLKVQAEKICRFQGQKDCFQYINKFKNFKKNNETLLQNHPPPVSLEKLACPSNSIYRSIAELADKIRSLHIEYRSNNFDRIGSVTIENCLSEGKLKKQKSYKRVRTNIGSLNSSRDHKKEMKKFTKTEEDEKRLRSEKIQNFKIDRRGSGKMPAYINEFFNKKSSKCGSGCSSYVFEMTSANMQNSKMASKMSKTIIPEEGRRKKEHVAVIKQRIERKTAHPNFKNQKCGQSSKKKKHH